jgi:hypothetical protein
MNHGEALKILGLAAGASQAAMRTAYLDLVKVWHPDRFVGNVRLQARATAQLSLVNEAYEFLRGQTASQFSTSTGTSTSENQRRGASAGSTDTQSHAAHYGADQASERTESVGPPPTVAVDRDTQVARWFAFVALVLGLALVLDALTRFSYGLDNETAVSSLGQHAPRVPEDGRPSSQIPSPSPLAPTPTVEWPPKNVRDYSLSEVRTIRARQSRGEEISDEELFAITRWIVDCDDIPHDRTVCGLYDPKPDAIVSNAKRNRDLVTVPQPGLDALAGTQQEVVYLTSGRTLAVKGHRLNGESTVLTLAGGGEVTLDNSLIQKIQPVPDIGSNALSRAAQPESAVFAPSPRLRRPINGEEFVGASDSGKAKLTVVNGTTEDAVVMLHNGGDAKRAIYVRAGDTVIMENIEHAFFSITFESGQDWSDEQRAFTRDVMDTDFLSLLDFTERTEGDTLTWHNHRITLHKVRDGNARTQPSRHRPRIPRDVSIESRLD